MMSWIRVGQQELALEVEPTGLADTPLPDIVLCSRPEGRSPPLRLCNQECGNGDGEGPFPLLPWL